MVTEQQIRAAYDAALRRLKPSERWAVRLLVEATGPRGPPVSNVAPSRSSGPNTPTRT